MGWPHSSWPCDTNVTQQTYTRACSFSFVWHAHVFLIVHLRESTSHTHAYLPTRKQLTGHVASWNRKCASVDWQLPFPHLVIKTAPKHILNKKEKHFSAHTPAWHVLNYPAIGWTQQGKAWLMGRLRTHRTCESQEEHTSDRCQNSQRDVVIGGALRLWRLRGNKMRAAGDGEKTGGRGKARKPNWRRGMTVKFWFSDRFMGNRLG